MSHLTVVSTRILVYLWHTVSKSGSTSDVTLGHTVVWLIIVSGSARQRLLPDEKAVAAWG